MYAMVGVTITKGLDAQFISAHLHHGPTWKLANSIRYLTHTYVQQNPAKQQYPYPSTGSTHTCSDLQPLYQPGVSTLRLFFNSAL